MLITARTTGVQTVYSRGRFKQQAALIWHIISFKN